MKVASRYLLRSRALATTVACISGIRMLDFTAGHPGKTTVDKLYDDYFLSPYKIDMLRILKFLNFLFNLHIKVQENLALLTVIPPSWIIPAKS